MKSIGTAVVLSPSTKSFYSIGVVEQLAAANIDVVGVVVRKMLTPARVKSEFSRDGKRLLKKAFTKLVLREPAKPGLGGVRLPSIRDAVSPAAAEEHNLMRTCARMGIETEVVDDLNQGLPFLERARPDLVVFTGGGLLRAPLLKAAGRGVLNCHAGVLPEYRGMDVVEWAVLYRDWDRVGITCHLMDEGVDTGPILEARPIAVDGCSDLTTLRQKLHAHMPETIVRCAVGLLDGTVEPQAQRAEDGQQFFIMEGELQKRAGRLLADEAARRQTP